MTGSTPIYKSSPFAWGSTCFRNTELRIPEPHQSRGPQQAPLLSPEVAPISPCLGGRQLQAHWEKQVRVSTGKQERDLLSLQALQCLTFYTQGDVRYFLNKALSWLIESVLFPQWLHLVLVERENVFLHHPHEGAALMGQGQCQQRGDRQPRNRREALTWTQVFREESWRRRQAS